jgi:spore coat polysaccharide biosynthesis predicted glycosyltransferase SpsG/CMP-N-acetylneuraminic acid synthetase
MVLGKPLIAHTIETALKVISPSNVIVITDDDEIQEVSEAFGAQVVREPENATGLKTLDQVMIRHLPDLEARGASDDDLLLTMQPTCPLVTAARITEAVQAFEKGAGSVITVKDDRHLTWTVIDGQPKPLYEQRVNRQQLPPQFRESGAIIGARISDIKKYQTRIVEPIALIELPESESLDIDTFADLVVAEHWLTRRRIILHANAGKALGMGHVYRTLALAQELARHEVLVVTSKEMPLGKEFFDSQVFNHKEVSSQEELIALAASFAADVVILDILDTSAELVQALKETAKVVTFEDLGKGAELADLTVSDLYPNPSAKSQLTGVQNAILAPSFETLARRTVIRPNVEHVLVLFGGTDPSNLADKSLRALEALGYKGRVTCVRGLGAEDLTGSYNLNLELKRNVKNMGRLMSESDLALSSAGRTITELMSIGVPTICLAQNQKELSHTHASLANGVVNLGLGETTEISQLVAAIEELLPKTARSELSLRQQVAVASRSNGEITRKIMALVYGGEPNETHL